MIKKYRINTPHVVYDIIENEAIIINLKNGNYYNLEKLGMVIWTILEKGVDPELVSFKIANHLKVQKEQFNTDLQIFLNDLLSEKLISLVEENLEQKTENQEFVDRFELPDFIVNYQCPIVRKYSDMQNALMLDPIHEFDENEWPEVNDDLYFKEQQDYAE